MLDADLPTQTVILPPDDDIAAQMIKRRAADANVAAQPAADDGVISGLDDALNRRVWTWTSPFNKEIVVQFRRPRAGTQEMVYRVLGDQSANQQLVRRYNAIAAVVKIGDADVPQPNSDAKFKALRDRIGFAGPDDEDIYDEPVNAFVFAYELAMFPQQLEMIADAEASNLAPDDIKRIIAASGLERPKASPTQPS